MSYVRWYAAWAVVIALLIALPVVAVLMHGNGAAADSANPFAPPSATPTPTPTPEPSPSTATTPAPNLTDVPLCANVWQAGRMLSTTYDGCQSKGVVVKPKKEKCLVTYQDGWWARPGQKVQETKGGKVTGDKRYAIALDHC